MICHALSKEEIEKLRTIFALVKECAAEVFGCPPVLLEKRVPKTHPKYRDFKLASYVVASNLIFPEWRQYGNFDTMVQFLSEITGRGLSDITHTLRLYKNSQIASKHHENITRVGNLVAERIVASRTNTPSPK